MNQEAINALQQFKEQLGSPQIEADSISEPKKARNFPAHIKPLKDRIMTALNNGARSVESVAKYCGESEKLVGLQLGRWVSRGMIGRHTSKTGFTRYYPQKEAKEMGILTAPQPINRKSKKVKSAQLDLFKQPAKAVKPVNPSPLADKDYVAFLEKRVTEWQVEARKQGNEKVKNALAKSLETRNITSELTEVMKEVMELRATVKYLESKLFGGK